MIHLNANFLLIISFLFTSINTEETIFLQIRDCTMLEIKTLPVQLTCEYLYIYNSSASGNGLEFFFTDFTSLEKPIYNSSELIDKGKSNCSHILFKNPKHFASEINLKIDLTTTSSYFNKHVKIGYDKKYNCLYIGEPYLKITIIDCDVLNIQVENTLSIIVFNEIFIYEKLGIQNLIYYHDFVSKKTVNLKSHLGLYIRQLNSSNIKLITQTLSPIEFILNIHIIPTSGGGYQKNACFQLEPSKNCYNTDCIYAQNRIKNVTFYPIIPKLDHSLCIKLIYTVDNHYFVDRLILLSKNNSDLVKTIIYMFTKSNAEDRGIGSFNKASSWMSRTNTSLNWSNDTVCFLNIQLNDENVEFSWDLRFQNKNNKNDVINMNYKFNLKVSTNGIPGIPEVNATVLKVSKDIRLIIDIVAVLSIMVIILISIFVLEYTFRNHQMLQDCNISTPVNDENERLNTGIPMEDSSVSPPDIEENERLYTGIPIETKPTNVTSSEKDTML